jgi:hypothetical protein
MNPPETDPLADLREAGEVEADPTLIEGETITDATSGEAVSDPAIPIRADAAEIRALRDLMAATTQRYEAQIAEMRVLLTAHREDENPTSGVSDPITPLRDATTVRFVEERRESFGDGGDTPFTTRSTTSEVLVLDMPIMGTRKSTTCVVVGGEPLPDWSGLAGTQSENPNCRRHPPGTSAEERGFQARSTKPDALAFTKKCNIFDQVSVFSNHAKTYGMDTELYAPDPNNPRALLYVPQYFSRFNHLTSKTDVLQLKKLWDGYSKENDAALVSVLKKSMDEGLRTTLNPYLDYAELPAVIILMMICNEVRPTTMMSPDIDRTRLMKKQVKDFTGHNVKAFAESVRLEMRRLENANELNKYVLLWLINCFVDLQIFRFSNVIHEKYYDPVKNTIKMLGDYTHSQLMVTLREKNIHWEQMLDDAVIMYTELVDDNHWTYAKSKDSKASPQFYLNEQEIKCFGCGKIGVKKPDCPDCKKKKEKGAVGKPKHQDRNTDKKKGGLEHPAPKDGEQPIKIVSGKIYFWCPKCNNWETTHFPKDHGKSGTKLTVSQLIAIKKDFLSSGKVPADFNFCQIITDEGINL